MDKYKLLYFSSAAHHLSFTKAAIDCNVVQGTISKQISALEDELNVKLFYRNPKSIQLTVAGQKLYEDARNYIEQYDKIENSLKKLNLLYDDTIRIGIGTLEHNLSVNTISNFVKNNPNTEILLSTYTYKRIESNLRNMMVDVVFCCDTCLNKIENIVKIPIWSKNWVIAANEKSEFWKMNEDDRSKLKNQRVISIFGDIFDPVYTHCVVNKFEQKNFDFTNAALSLITLLQADVGIAVIPSFFNNKLCGIRMEDNLHKPLKSTFSIGYNPNNPKINTINNFLKYII